MSAVWRRRSIGAILPGSGGTYIAPVKYTSGAAFLRSLGDRRLHLGSARTGRAQALFHPAGRPDAASGTAGPRCYAAVSAGASQPGRLEPKPPDRAADLPDAR